MLSKNSNILEKRIYNVEFNDKKIINFLKVW